MAQKGNSEEIESEENARNDVQASHNRVRRSLSFHLETNSKEICIEYSQVGQGDELLYICTSCGLWLNADCSSAEIPAGYICEDYREEPDNGNRRYSHLHYWLFYYVYTSYDLI
ncbi:hypothetical protein RF11_13669 [Thelohanellus kitauei]|uniref:Uncharacterized protein n=1 Tax=Thelohanellus kitauei TaxID=669202 RepID=A0A0C2N5F5_THEKT|nr:hypothetical protein RF11_13669 [Thelohanellus kitauei]